jgi:hypothetical protein
VCLPRLVSPSLSVTQNDTDNAKTASQNEAAVQHALMSAAGFNPYVRKNIDSTVRQDDNKPRNEFAQAEAVEVSVDRLWEKCKVTSIASQHELAYMDSLPVCGKNIPNKPGYNNPSPPVLRGNVEGTHTFRFKQVAEASSTVNLYVDDLAFMMSVASASNTLRTVWESIKVNRISIWTPSRQYSGTLQDPRETSLTWLGDYTPRSEVFGTVNQQTGVCHITSAPPKNSGSGKWQKVGQGANNPLICKLTIPDQSIVDITVSFVFDDDAVSTLAVTGYTSLTIGNLYYPCADSFFGTKKLEPMGMLTPT